MSRLLLSLLLSLFLQTGFAQQSLRSPAEYMPHPFGRQFTPHHLQVEYAQYIARESERVQLTTYGYTNEGRPLLLAFISSPANLARLENIRQNNLKTAGFADETAAGGELPAIVWLSFGVHGNEAGASESAMKVLHALATQEQYLDNTLIILDPCVNPDGNNRYTNWYRQVAPLYADPWEYAREHREPWPGGRPNHYLFDLNRDWAWGAQIETRQRLALYRQWLPHIHADFHEQFPNSPSYFAPAAEPFHPAITAWQRDFQTEIGQNIARQFDSKGWLYFTRESFDLFYPSYGDTYPTFAGAIGMTFEQAGHGVAGRAVELDNGDILTLEDRIAHHAACAMATVETASHNAAALVKQFKAFYDQSQKQAAGAYQSFVVSHANPPDQLKAFTRFLDMHHIRYGKAGKKRSAEAYDYRSGDVKNIAVDPEDLVVSAYQPAGILAQVLLEPAAFLPDSMTYDITAWSMIHSFGFDAFALKTRLDPEAPWQHDPFVLPSWPQKTPYAYLAPWTSMEDARFLAAILQEGFVVRQAAKPFRIEGNDYDRGTLLITRGDNRQRADYQESVQRLAEAFQRRITPVSTGMVNAGSDFGSESMQLVRAPRIALLSGEGVGSDAFGATWHYFEQILGYPVSIIETASFQPSLLQDFDALVMPSGFYNWDDGVKKKLSEWVRSGGRIIATGNALRWLQSMDGVNLASKDADPLKTEVKKDIVPTRHEDRERSHITHQAPGALFETTTDPTNPLAFGLPNPYYTLKRTAAAYAYLEKGGNGAYLAQGARHLGFTGAAALGKIDKTLVAGAEPIGRGAAIYLVDDPLFRGFWHTGHLLFANALFFGR